ncbi:multiple epidermal growth factor-like domains protein 10 [Ostrea edulis]|uniref:multiple epidermal growth factor-like domains protein 10 n=1 Tax=Ostrea edulis TaxID=37623 RepID=UPI0024AF22BC|nr:multiple epidermal growth factor-like domains protein 10 [Ostrea edulis]
MADQITDEKRGKKRKANWTQDECLMLVTMVNEKKNILRSKFIECEVSLYGDNCSKSCGHCLRPEQCDNINGTCKNGCKSGFQGTFCNETCMMGTFGKHCRELCNVNCKGCDTITGICDSGCYTGWKGSHCSEECDSGRFGAACGLKCGNCLDGIQCDHVNGSCFSGCNEGFRGPLCKEVDNQVQEEETGNNWETMFYGVLGAFCVILVLVGVLVFALYTIWKRHRNIIKKYRASDSSPKKEKVTEDHGNENVNSEYQELGELSPSSPYDSIH